MNRQDRRADGGHAQGQVRADDLMVRIRSLPLGLDVNMVMAGISEDVSRETGLDKNLMTYYWQTFDAVRCPALRDAVVEHPVLVDMHVPGSLTDAVIAGLMFSLAASLQTHTGIPEESVFIHTHVPKEGHIYIAGAVAKGADLESGAGWAPLPSNGWCQTPVQPYERD